MLLCPNTYKENHFQFQEILRNAYAQRHDSNTKCVVVRIYDIETRSARARAQNGSSETDAMTVRLRRRAGAVATRVTLGRRCGHRAIRRLTSVTDTTCAVYTPVLEI